MERLGSGAGSRSRTRVRRTRSARRQEATHRRGAQLPTTSMGRTRQLGSGDTVLIHVQEFELFGRYRYSMIFYKEIQ